MTAVYNFSDPLIPIFGVFVKNPSNLTGNPYTPFVGSSSVGIQHSKTGPIGVVQINGTNDVSGFDVQPLQRGSASGSSLVLSYSNMLITSDIAISKPGLIGNTTLANGTRVLSYSIEAINKEPFDVSFNQVFLMYLPNAQANYTGSSCSSCAPPTLRTVTGTTSLFGEFYVGPKTNYTFTVKVWFSP